MKKISFDYSSLENNVMPSIDASINNLSNAHNTINSTRIPHSFSYISTLRNINSSLNNIIKNQRDIKKEIIDLNAKINRVVDTTCNEISKIQIVQIKK